MCHLTFSDLHNNLQRFSYYCFHFSKWKSWGSKLNSLPTVNPQVNLGLSGSQAWTLPALPGYLHVRPSVPLKLPFRDVHEWVVLWFCVIFFFFFWFLCYIYFFSLNPAWQITGLMYLFYTISDVTGKLVSLICTSEPWSQGVSSSWKFAIHLSFTYVLYSFLWLMGLIYL